MNQNKIINLSRKELKNFSWKNYPNVRTIDLSNTNLNHFTWEDCPRSLRKINLSGNNLTSFDFKKAPKILSSINLSNNNLSNFSFKGNTELIKTINLSNNNLVNFKFDGEVKIYEVNLSYNKNLIYFSWKDSPLCITKINIEFTGLNESNFDFENIPFSVKFCKPFTRKLNIKKNKLQEVECDSSCSICFNKEEIDFKGKFSKKIKTTCGHTFHSSCLHDWLMVKFNCPYCRTSF